MDWDFIQWQIPRGSWFSFLPYQLVEPKRKSFHLTGFFDKKQVVIPLSNETWFAHKYTEPQNSNLRAITIYRKMVNKVQEWRPIGVFLWSFETYKLIILVNMPGCWKPYYSVSVYACFS